jgi:hypothetical protein
MLTAQCSAVVFSSLRADDMAPCESISRTRSVSPRKAAVVRSSSDRTMFIVAVADRRREHEKTTNAPF